MKNLYAYLVSIPIVLLALVPAIIFKIPMPKADLWFWYVLIAGFLGFYTLFLKTNIFIKIIAIGAFINCFFSSAPYFSFTAYISLVTCCYFYILCSRVERWDIVFNTLKAVLFLNLLILVMQFLGKDVLLLFGNGGAASGIIGNKMQMGSLSVVLSSLLISANTFYILFPVIVSKICSSAGALFSVLIGVTVYLCSQLNNKKIKIVIGIAMLLFISLLAYQTGEITGLETSGRLPVWIKAAQLTNIHPVSGYGIGTFKYLFHPLSGRVGAPFRTAHNFLIQILFETGYSGLLFILTMLSCLTYKLIKTKNTLCLAGLAMLVTNGLAHFPDRCIQCVLIIIVFLAFCSYKIKEKELWPHK